MLATNASAASRAGDYYRVVAKNVAGTDYGAGESFVTTPSQWSATYLPQPSNSGGGQQAFGVSCVAPDDCMAVGRNWNLAVHTHATLAEHWDGATWSPIATPNPSGLDEGWLYDRYAELLDASCATTDFCVAVGQYKGADDVVRLLIEQWDGDAWTMIAAPTPSGATDTRLRGVACLSPNDCTAAGFYRDSSGLATPLIERWDGEKWAIAPLPSIPETSEARLFDVDCATETNCVAVGQSLSTDNTERTLAEHWDGSHWSVRSTVTPGIRQEALFEAVSCPTTSWCTAVGYFRGGPTLETLAEHWNGTDWAVQSTPTPENEGVLTGVSCSTPSTCTAAGYYYSPSELDHGWRPLIERWKDTAWSLLEIDVLSAPAGWWRESSLNSISCPGTEACVAVGDALSGPPGGLSPYRAFAEHELTGPIATPTPIRQTPPIAEALPSLSDSFEIRRTVTRCTGQIVLTVSTPLTGAFEARATASTQGSSRPQGHSASRGNRPCGAKRVGAGANSRPFPYGKGSATATGGGRYALVVTPNEKGRKAIRGRRVLRVEIVVTFTPLDGTPSSKRKVISLQPR